MLKKTERSVSAYAAELRHLTEHYAYGDVLGEMFRDQLVCGINNEVIQRRLLAEDKLTFDRTLEMALCMESASSHARDMSGSAPVCLPAAVNVIKHSQDSGRPSGKPASAVTEASTTPMTVPSKTQLATSVARLVTSPLLAVVGRTLPHLSLCKTNSTRVHLTASTNLNHRSLLIMCKLRGEETRLSGLRQNMTCTLLTMLTAPQ